MTDRVILTTPSNIIVTGSPAQGPAGTANAASVAVADSADHFVATNVETALAELATVGPVVIYRQGGTARKGVFTTWATAYAACIAYGGQCSMIIDPVSGTPTVPAGAYAMKSIHLVGMTTAGGAIPGLVLSDGVTFTSIGRTDTILFDSESTAPIMTVTGTTRLDASQTYFDGESGVPFFQVSSGGVLVLSAALLGSYSGLTFTIDAGGFFFGSLGPGVVVTSDNFDGAGDVFITTESPSAVVSSTQPGLSGTYDITHNSVARNVSVADTAGKIVGTNVETALAEVAAVTSRRRVASKTIGHADLTAEDTVQSISFDSALPAGALAIGAFAIVSQAFTDATDADTCWAYMRATNGFFFGTGEMEISAAGTVGPNPVNSRTLGFVGGYTPRIDFELQTGTTLAALTKGAATFYVVYDDYTTP
jgi:hypothetical protein